MGVTKVSLSAVMLRLLLRLSVAVLTLLLGVVLVYFADGVVTPIFSEEVEYHDHCSQ